METLQPPDQNSARVIEAYCALLDSPSARLRFIRRAVARCQSEGIGQTRWPVLERFRLKKIVVEELVPLLPADAPAPLAVRTALWAYRLRYVIYFITAVGASAAVLAVCFLGVRLVLSLNAPTASANVPVAAAAAPSVPTQGPVDNLPQYAPEQIWLVEQGQGYEVYSNGARVLTDFETDGPPRHYFAFPKGAETPDAAIERSGDPVGIVFHTSQSHMAPFKAEFNQKLQSSSRALLEFVQKHGLYNYVIDRFGRIYRIVKDGDTADHAGNSVWADDRFTYADLSGGFLGVCFEAEWTPDMQIRPDQINEAQIYAGRVLTAMLRSKYSIADADCVTHALVSVSPASRLIGFHMDWGHSFPFASMGLSDKYAVEAPSISIFGFGHDGQFDRAVGEQWQGVVLADEGLASESASRGVETSVVRRERQDRYRSIKEFLGRHQTVSAGDLEEDRPQE